MSVYEDERNPMRIPDLTPMYEAVRDFVKEHQGDKGFICTDDSTCDTIWCVVRDLVYFEIYEYEVKAIRVKDNNLEILYDDASTRYDEKSCGDMMDDNCWFDVRLHDCIDYIPTIFNIAENIQEYV